MKGTASDLFYVSRRLGVCEIATSARNWDTMHNAVIITNALSPTSFAAFGERLHRELDKAFHAAQNNPMEAPSPNSVCVVTMRGSLLLTLLTCIEKMLESSEAGNIQVQFEGGSDGEHLSYLRGARASFYEYLRSREVGAEVLFEEG